jgi:hypothetical protein
MIWLALDDIYVEEKRGSLISWPLEYVKAKDFPRYIIISPILPR